jgi:hypothetical protein
MNKEQMNYKQMKLEYHHQLSEGYPNYILKY